MTPIRVNVACLSVSVSDFSPLMPQAGVDPLAGDIMGRLNLSREGLQKRNQHVFEEVLGRGIKCVVTFGGSHCVSELVRCGTITVGGLGPFAAHNLHSTLLVWCCLGGRREASHIAGS